MDPRTKRIVLGGLLAVAAVSPGWAQSGAAQTAGSDPARVAREAAHLSRIWARPVWLRARADRCDALAFHLSQQLMTRVTAVEEIAARPLSAFVPECTLGELRDGLAAQFGYVLEPYAAGESTHLRLRPGRAPRPAAKGRPATKPGQPAAIQAKPAPATAAALRKTIDLSAVEIEEDAEGLPAVLQYLSEGAQVPVMAEYTPRADVCPHGMTAAQFIAQLNGLTLREALDRTARAFDYTWTHAGRWFLFRKKVD